MLWLIYSLFSAVSGGARNIIHMHVMKTESPFSYALVENLLSSIAFLPLLAAEFVLPLKAEAWIIVLAASSRPA